MKKWITLFLIALFFVSAYAINIQRKSIKTDQGVAVWSILADTTIYSYSNYKPNDIMRVNYWAADTSGDDSLALTVNFQAKGPKGWITIKTLTITTDSTESYWLLTNTAISFSDSLRWSATGGAANSKDSPTLLEMEYVGKDYDY